MLDFDSCFSALNGRRVPFRWQRRLFERVMSGGWPRLMRLPTASGKTAIIDIAVLALAAGASAARRRIAFVVDRRVVVDEAAARAEAIARRLKEARAAPGDVLHPVAVRLCELAGSDEPLVVTTLRGGIQTDDSWARSPAQPAVILSTVDQVGSRLLFRAYGGGSSRSWPIHAGLLGIDCLLVVDEAHCAQPFCETIRLIAEKYQGWAEDPPGRPLSLVRMSATPGEEPDFMLEDEDLEKSEELRRRVHASKPAELTLVKSQGDSRGALVKGIVSRALNLLDRPRVVGVVVNRVADARAVFSSLPLPEGSKLLLTGRARGWERDRLLSSWIPRLRAGERGTPNGPLVVVATQCIEVGANLDFDALVTEIASLDALRQRFGRLNRLGCRDDAQAGVVAVEEQVGLEEDGSASEPDPVYEHAIARTWAWLCERADAPRKSSGKSEAEMRHVDFGISALEETLPDAEELCSLCSPLKHAPVLLPAHLDLLAQTSPLPAQSPEVSVFLHGYQSGPPEATVVWRADLPDEETTSWADRVAVQPPVTGEGCPVPYHVVRGWLAETRPRDDGVDLEGQDRAEVQDIDSRRSALRWRGPEESQIVSASGVRPGDTVVVPASYGGCDAFGWNPDSRGPVRDIGDAVAHDAGRRPVIRLGPEVLRGWVDDSSGSEALRRLRAWASGNDGEEDLDPRKDLLSITEDTTLPDWLRGAATRLKADPGMKRMVAAGAPAVVGQRRCGREVSTADEGSELTVPITLPRHSDGVRGWAVRLADSVAMGNGLRADLTLASWLHDLGKADPRFQVYLRGGDEVAAVMAEALLAKSGANVRHRAAMKRARKASGYPDGCRHELMSVNLIENVPEFRALSNNWDLVLHLVASHHGYCRPFAPVVRELKPVGVSVEHDGMRLHGSSDHQLHKCDSGIAERYWGLVRRYGWWGLAWLEACLRLADHRRSEEEEMEGGDSDG